MVATSVLRKIVSALNKRFKSKATPAVNANVITGPFDISDASTTPTPTHLCASAGSEVLEELESSAPTYLGKAVVLLTDVFLEHQYIATVLSSEYLDSSICDSEEIFVPETKNCEDDDDDESFFFNNLKAVFSNDNADDLEFEEYLDSDSDSDFEEVRGEDEDKDDELLDNEDLDAPFDTLSTRVHHLAQIRSNPIQETVRERIMALSRSPYPTPTFAEPSHKTRRSALELGHHSPLRLSWSAKDFDIAFPEEMMSTNWDGLAELEEVRDLEAFFDEHLSPIPSDGAPSSRGEDEVEKLDGLEGLRTFFTSE